jgi:PAS domain S-box-containing protein
MKKKAGVGVIAGHRAAHNTARRQAEEALLETNLRLTHAMDLTHLFDWEYDVASGLFTFSDRYYALHGTTSEIEGGNVMSAEAFQATFLHQDDAHLVGAEIAKAAASDDPNYLAQAEVRMLRRDGEVRHVLVNFAITKDAAGRTVKLYGANQDLTDRKRAEEEMMLSKALTEAVVENVPLMVFVKEATDLRFVVLNRAGEELMGYDRNVMLGKNNLDLFPPEQAAFFMAKDRQVLSEESGMVDIPEEPIQTAKKGLRLLHTRKFCIKGSDGTTKYLLGISEDITDRKKLEEGLHLLNKEQEQMIQERTEQLFEAREELVRKEKLAILGQLSGSVAHELRNPLGVMSNAVYYLKLVHCDADETTKEYLEIITHAIDDSRRIITDLLDFARTRQPQRQSVSAEELVRQSLERCSIPDNVTVTVDFPQALPSLNADPLQLEQLLTNFITNGVQAMPDGGALRVWARRADNDFVAISVADTGKGITPEHMKKLFQPLFTTKAKGVGLGLVVCRNLAEANGGRIEVESEVGKGTSFTVVLPVEKEAG